MNSNIKMFSYFNRKTKPVHAETTSCSGEWTTIASKTLPPLVKEPDPIKNEPFVAGTEQDPKQHLWGYDTAENPLPQSTIVSESVVPYTVDQVVIKCPTSGKDTPLLHYFMVLAQHERTIKYLTRAVGVLGLGFTVLTCAFVKKIR
jgi:hypothetical protein